MKSIIDNIAGLLLVAIVIAVLAFLVSLGWNLGELVVS